MVERSDAFYAGLGVNMHKEADALIHRLIDFDDYEGSELIMEGDYGNYDQGMPMEVGYAACTIVYRILEKAGYNEEALNIVRGLLTDSLYPMVTVLCDVFRCPGLQPSGKYATAEDNSLRGLVLLVYAWYSLEATKEFDFFEYVHPLKYGDDLLAAIKKSKISVFNGHIYSKFVEEVYGMTYTLASKDAQMVSHLSAKEVTFLKRRFVYFPKEKKYVAPLDLNSIYKMLQWRIPSRAVSHEEQMLSTLQSCLNEVFFHFLDEELFHAFRLDLIELVLSEGMFTKEILVAKLPCFDEIYSRIFGNSAGVQLD
jgi:hypothetical protein